MALAVHATVTLSASVRGAVLAILTLAVDATKVEATAVGRTVITIFATAVYAALAFRTSA